MNYSTARMVEDALQARRYWEIESSKIDLYTPAVRPGDMHVVLNAGYDPVLVDDRVELRYGDVCIVEYEYDPRLLLLCETGL